MRPALARHDAIARAAVESVGASRVIVKMTGDGIHAAFDDTLDAITRHAADAARARRQQQAIFRCMCAAACTPESTSGADNDFFGTAVNRAARNHERRPWRPDAAFEDGRRVDRAPVARRASCCGNWVRCGLRDSRSRAPFPGSAAGLKDRLPGASLARENAEQLPQGISSFVGRARGELVEAPA